MRFYGRVAGDRNRQCTQDDTMSKDEYRELIDERDAEAIVAGGGVHPKEQRAFSRAHWIGWLCFLIGWGLLPNIYYLFLPDVYGLFLPDLMRSIPSGAGGQQVSWVHKLFLLVLPWGLGSFCYAAPFAYIYKNATLSLSLTGAFFATLLTALFACTSYPVWITALVLSLPIPAVIAIVSVLTSHLIWILVLSVSLPIPAGILGYRLVSRLRRGVDN